MVCRPSPNRKERLRHARNYAVYYGSGKEERLSAYDIAIVEPAGHNSNGIQALKSKGTLTLAYVSVLETNPSLPLYPLLKEEDFIAYNGRPFLNEEYQNRIVKLYSQRWQSLLVHHVGQLLFHQGYDGIFLDTLADLEYMRFSAQDYERSVCAAVNLLRELRERFEPFVFVQNNGYQRVHQHTAAFLDGICCENPLHPEQQTATKEKIGALESQLLHLSRQDLHIFMLLNRPDDRIRRLAEKNTFCFYVSNDYTRLSETNYSKSNLELP